MNTRKFYCILASVLSMALPIFALEVDEKELKSAASDTIVFINYTGPHSKIDSMASIKKLGSDMGYVVAKSLDSKISAGSSAKYSVIHAIDSSVKEKLDADIILIGPNATVDHIDNLRHIIASYLVAAYGYSEKDAETVAVFVTVYNAVYRNKLDSFNSKYKQVVMDNLSASSCGLSVNYKEWPGQSQIVIPLFDVNGGLSTVDTSVISDSEVVKHMQEDEDKNVDARKDMVDIKEREAEQATKKAQDAQKEAVQEQKKLTEEKKKTEEKKQQAEEAQKKAEKNPEDKKAQKEAEQKKEEYEEQKKVEEEQKKVTEEAKENAAEQQAIADKKNTEAQEERKTIAKDQQDVIQKEIENAKAPAAYGIELTNEKSMLSGLIKVNTDTGALIKASPVTVIRNRTIYQAGDNFIAIAGENSGNGTVKVVLLSPDTMEICAESNETASEDSVLVQDGEDYYCVILEGKNCKVAKYDKELNLKLKSALDVASATPITVTDSFLIVTDAKGTVRLLDKSDLSPISAKPSNLDAK